MQQNNRTIGIYLKRLDGGYILQIIPSGANSSLQSIFKLLIPEFTYNRITCLENVNHLSFSKSQDFISLYPEAYACIAPLLLAKRKVNCCPFYIENLWQSLHGNITKWTPSKFRYLAFLEHAFSLQMASADTYRAHWRSASPGFYLFAVIFLHCV